MAFNWNNYWRQQGMAAAQSQQTPAPVHAGVPPTQYVNPIYRFPPGAALSPALQQLAAAHAGVHPADVSQHPQPMVGYQYLIGNPHAPVGGAGGPAPVHMPTLPTGPIMPNDPGDPNIHGPTPGGPSAVGVNVGSSQTSPWNFTATPGPPELTHAPPPVVGSSVSTPGGPPPSAPLQQLAQNIAYNPTFGSSFPNAQPNPASTQTNPAMNGPGYAVTDPSYYQGFINAGLNPSASYSASNLSSTLNPQTMASLGYQVGTSNFNPSAGPQYFGPLIAANQYTK